MPVATRRRIKLVAAMGVAQDQAAVEDLKRMEAPPQLQQEQEQEEQLDQGMELSRRERVVPLVVVCRRPSAAVVLWLEHSCRCR